MTTTSAGAKQITKLSWKPSKQELIPTGEEPLVPDEDLEAGQRNVRGLDTGSPGFQRRWAQVRSS